MHFHLPKPLHGWRAFAGEVGIIVLGVLIALAAGQLADEWQWQQKVGIVRKSLMGELGNDRARWQANMSFVPCARREILLVDRWATKGDPNIPAPDTSAWSAGLFWWMHWANWNLATSSGTLDHFPIADQLEFAALYDGIVHRQADIQSAADLSEQVRSLIPLATDTEGRRELRSVLGRLTGKIDALTNNDAYMNRHFDALGVRPDDRDIAADEATSPHCHR
jgi:hypothetical protein